MHNDESFVSFIKENEPEVVFYEGFYINFRNFSIFNLKTQKIDRGYKGAISEISEKFPLARIQIPFNITKDDSLELASQLKKIRLTQQEADDQVSIV